MNLDPKYTFDLKLGWGSMKIKLSFQSWTSGLFSEGSGFGCAAGACTLLVPQPGMETVPATVKVQSPNHCAREFPASGFRGWKFWGIVD